MNKNTLISVKNRSAGMVIYSIAEMGIRREFAPGEVKKIPYDELEKLSYQSGGRELMESYLQLADDSVIEDLNINAEQEYYMSEEQIVDLLEHGSLDAFLDCLDYAPVGVIDLVKQYSVSLPLNSMDKREALKAKTGFDVSTAIRNLEAERAEENEDNQIHPASKRRTNVSYKEEKKEEPATSARRSTPNYKIVNK